MSILRGRVRASLLFNALLTFGLITVLTACDASSSYGPSATESIVRTGSSVQSQARPEFEVESCGPGTYQDGANSDGSPECDPDEDGGGTGSGSGGGTYYVYNPPTAPPAPHTTTAQKLFAMAQQWFSARQSTKAGPGGGAEACAWAFNQISQAATGMTYGINPNFVPSVETALKNAAGTNIPQSSTQAGDIDIQGQDGHMGICANSGCSQVYSNSTGNECFCDLSNPTFSGAGWSYSPNVTPRFYHLP